jgi:hypothetical protein
MKHIILGLSSVGLLVGCTEKTLVSLKVFRDKAEDVIVEAAGEGEVAIELYSKQYATLKERLIKMKTLESTFKEQLEQAYAKNDPRRVKIYEDRLKDFNVSVPQAEDDLKQFYNTFQTQQAEIALLKEDIAVHKAASMVTNNTDVTSSFQTRADTIKQLTAKLKEHAKRAQAVLSVNRFEETFAQ